MSALFQKESGNLWLLRISGILTKAELDSAQVAAREELAQVGSIKLCVILEDFQGWERGADWGDMSFSESHGDHIERIGIVADPQWATKALMFAGAGLRRTPVKFFSDEELDRARAWLISGEG